MLCGERNAENHSRPDFAAQNESAPDSLSHGAHRLNIPVLSQIKRERKIFFLVAWLDAFIGGQQSAKSDQIVHHYLDTAQIEPDTRLKILHAVDELDRTV